MTDFVRKHDEVIPKSIRDIVSLRYHTITKSINREFWGINDDKSNSIYVGSYGRSTSVSTSDIDILVVLPPFLYNHFRHNLGNVQSRFLQSIKQAIYTTYPNTDIHADGQVVKVNFSDDIKFEVLPAFEKDYSGYYYPDSNSGGTWRITYPKEEQKAVENKNKYTNGLYNATCRHIRKIRDRDFKSYTLHGIVIDSFVYHAMGNWCFVSEGNGSSQAGSYECALLDFFGDNYLYKEQTYIPGSNQLINIEDSKICLGKILLKMVV